MPFDLGSLMSGGMGTNGGGVPASPGFRMPGFGPRFGGAMMPQKVPVMGGPQTQPGNPSMVGPGGVPGMGFMRPPMGGQGYQPGMGFRGGRPPLDPAVAFSRLPPPQGMPGPVWGGGIDRSMGPPPMPQAMPQSLATLPARMPTPQGQPFVQRRY